MFDNPKITRFVWLAALFVLVVGPVLVGCQRTGSDLSEGPQANATEPPQKCEELRKERDVLKKEVEELRSYNGKLDEGGKRWRARAMKAANERAHYYKEVVRLQEQVANLERELRETRLKLRILEEKKNR